MADLHIEKLAKLLVNYSVEVKPGQTVFLQGSTISEPLIKALYVEILKAGGHPHVGMTFEDQEYLFYQHASDAQIDFLDPFMLHLYENVDAMIVVFPNLNPHALTSVDAALKQRRTQVQSPFMETLFKRWGEGTFKWVGSGYPSPAAAQEAKMALTEYAEFVYNAMQLDLDDPVAYWQDFSARQAKLCERLNQVKTIRLLGEDTDLTYSCAGRKWINCDGRYNFPDGEVFTGPVEDSVEGQIRFTYPGIFQGEEIEDICLTFEKGKVIKATAARGEALLHALLETDAGAGYVGEAAIGTNEGITRFTKCMLFDEKMGGTIHMALGRGIPESGSQNVSAIHWDMLKDMRQGGQIFADGQLIYQDGAFV
jgi:aminopeptidase